MRLHKLRSVLYQRYPGTMLQPITDAEVDRLKDQYPNIPDDLISLLREIGCGTIGDSRYMIHGPTGPEAFFDTQTAKQLDGVVLIGDDFSGGFEVYDSKNGWAFGSVGSTGEFVAGEKHKSFFEFIEDWDGDGN